MFRFVFVFLSPDDAEIGVAVEVVVAGAEGIDTALHSQVGSFQVSLSLFDHLWQVFFTLPEPTCVWLEENFLCAFDL